MSVISTSALAHPGHDHSHWTSEWIHFVAIAAAVSVIGLIAYSVRSKRLTQQKKEG